MAGASRSSSQSGFAGPQIGTNPVRSDINVTPLVDVVLVLLIIFMVIQPILQMGYDAEVPPKDPNPGNQAPPPTDQLILHMDRDGHMFINKQQLSAQDFPDRLKTATQSQPNKLVFFAADGELP